MKQKLDRTPQGMFVLMRRHPYLLTFFICALLLPFGYADRAKITTGSCIYLGLATFIIAAAAIFLFNLGKDLKEKLLLTGITALCATACMMIIGYVENKAVAVAFVALALTIAAAFFLRINNAISDTAIIALLILLGIALRFVYVLYTGSGDRQHDVGFWNHTWGHANYIEYWYKNGLKLPDFDVRMVWQYYHPPFHHWLMALLLKLLTALGVEYLTACEALQMLPMLYSSLSMIVAYRIFRLVKLEGKPLMAPMAIMCFHPTFILFAGEFNNDILLFLLMMSSIMWGLRWYREPVMKNIIPLALCIGLGMMTKLSGWMVAPAVAFLFLCVLIRNIKKPGKYIGQYVVFGIICVPLGVWWQVRNLIKFKVPLTYVPLLSDQDPIYGGNLSVTERLFNFGGQQLTYVYDAFTAYGSPYNEFNPTLGLLKTAMFDEGTNSITAEHFPQIAVTAPIMYWLSVILAVLCLGCFIYMLVKKSDNINGAERVYFALLFGVQFVSYYMFAFAYPFTCTYNIRYAMPLIPLCVMGMGFVLQKTKESQKAPVKWFRYLLYALTTAFCAMSYIVYTQIGTSM